MPVHSGRDNKGGYFQWGEHGKKYHYGSTSASKKISKQKATNQGRAAYANGYKGK